MRNVRNDSYAGTIKAALFLKQFIKKNTPWAHLDIAATGYNVGHLPYVPKKGASGLFVRLLTEFCLKDDLLSRDSKQKKSLSKKR
jgi:leucyl aminopeptidase